MLNHEFQVFVVRAALLTLNQASNGLFTHALNLFYDSGTHLGLMRLFLSILWLIYLGLRRFLTARILPRLCELCLGILNALLAEGKAREVKGKNWILEKPLFSLFTILVHGVPNRLKFNICTTDQFLDFLFLEMVGKNNRKHG